MLNDLTNWKEAVKNAKHYLAVGQKELYLSDKGNLPWKLAISCEPSGSHRLDISTSVWFRAKHKSGLSFRWNFDIEKPEANGRGYYMIDTEAIRRVMSLLPASCARDFKKYLQECTVAVENKAKEWYDLANDQNRYANALREVSS